jgi:hypothetical protein
VQHAVQLAAHLGQLLWKRLPGTPDLALFPALALADDGVKFLLDRDKLFITLAGQRLRLTIAALAGFLQRYPKRLAGVSD